MAEQVHYPIQVGHIVSEEYKGQYIVCACQADQWGEGPTIPVKEYPAHLFDSIDVDDLAQVIERASDAWWNDLSDHGPSVSEYRAAAVKAWLVYG